jgi:hypothetical protein
VARAWKPEEWERLVLVVDQWVDTPVAVPVLEEAVEVVKYGTLGMFLVRL